MAIPLFCRSGSEFVCYDLKWCSQNSLIFLFSFCHSATVILVSAVLGTNTKSMPACSAAKATTARKRLLKRLRVTALPLAREKANEARGNGLSVRRQRTRKCAVEKSRRSRKTKSTSCFVIDLFTYSFVINFLLLISSTTETLTALSTTTRDHTAPAYCFHTIAKSGGAHTLDFTGLVCSFHFRLQKLTIFPRDTVSVA